MAQWSVTFYLSDESAMTWTQQADDHDDALSRATEYFDDGGAGPIAGMSGSERDPANTGPLVPEEVPAEGMYLYEVLQQSGRR